MRGLFLAILMVTIVLGPAACGSSGDDDEDVGVRVEDEDAGSVVQLSAGETLVVELDGNPSTGYNWYVKTIDENVLKQDGEPEFEADRDVPGSAGIVTLRFTAVAAGTTTLALDYYRQFEPDVPPLQTWQIVVEVT